MRWYINRTGQPEGPLEESAIVAMIKGGEVHPGANICPEGGQSWQPVGSHPPFAEAATAGAPVGPALDQPLPENAATIAMDGFAIQAQVAAAHAAQQPQAAPAQLAAPAPLQATPQPFLQATPQAASQPPFQPPSQPQPAGAGNKVPLLIGAGCALLLLLSMCGGGFAYFFSASSSSEDAEEEAMEAPGSDGASEAAPAVQRERPVTNPRMDARTVEPCVTECSPRGPSSSPAYRGCFSGCILRRAAEINARARAQ